MNIVVSLDNSYLHMLKVMLTSLFTENPNDKFDIYVLNSSIKDYEFEDIRQCFESFMCNIIDIKVDENMFNYAPVTERYPKEMYYRIFACKLLPQNLDKALYLDPDLVIINPIDKLYNIDLKDKYFAGATHISKQFNLINEVRLNMNHESQYINSGVLLMNLEILRKYQTEEEVYDFINENSSYLLLPDQDVINGLYSDKMIFIDACIYNLGEIYYKKLKYLQFINHEKINMKYVVNNTCIIHYYGRNKPWKEGYLGDLDVFYHIYEKKLKLIEEEISLCKDKEA